MRARTVSGLEPQASLRANASLIVRTRLEELLSLGEKALAPEAVIAQHDTRIAAKRLRYVLEIVAGCFGAEADQARIVARDLQGVLGDIHDCDVMLPRAAGIDSLEALLRARRGELFAVFRDRWLAEAGDGVWDSLARVL